MSMVAEIDYILGLSSLVSPTSVACPKQVLVETAKRMKGTIMRTQKRPLISNYNGYRQLSKMNLSRQSMPEMPSIPPLLLSIGWLHRRKLSKNDCSKMSATWAFVWTLLG